jgi:hypothetical protein
LIARKIERDLRDDAPAPRRDLESVVADHEPLASCEAPDAQDGETAERDACPAGDVQLGPARREVEARDPDEREADRSEDGTADTHRVGPDLDRIGQASRRARCPC